MKRRLFAGRHSPGLHSPGRPWPGRLLFSGLAVALALAVLAFVVDSSRPSEGLQQLTSVQRLEPDGSTRQVGLPDEHHVPSGTQGRALASYTWQADLGPAPSGQALYFPGLLGSARLVLTWAYVWTKNIWVSTGAHIINDWTLIASTVFLAPLVATT